MKRNKTKSIHISNLIIGDNTPVSVQSMTCTKTEDIPSTLKQIQNLEAAGCELIRVAVPHEEAARAIASLKKEMSVPLVADIHFDYKLALLSMKSGADKIRINPGNIGSRDRVEAVLNEAKSRNIPIRIGVNGGSLKKEILQKYGGLTSEGLVESALEHVAICESLNFENIVLSVKTSNVPLMIETNRLLSQKVNYPLHLGVTEAGTIQTGILRSAVGIGTLLAEGIGDTIRVSLTGDPVEEVKAGYEILKSLKLRQRGVTVISCPTCGRTQTGMIPIAEAVEKEMAQFDVPLTVAVMGCGVNGPGEAKEADIGMACGKHEALLFRKGDIIRKVPEKEIVQTLVEEVERFIREAQDYKE